MRSRSEEPAESGLVQVLKQPDLPGTLPPDPPSEPRAGATAARIQALLAPRKRRLTTAERNAAKRAYWRKLRDRDAKQPDPASSPSPFLSRTLLPASWTHARYEPPVGAVCGCCHGHRFWREASEPKGWRCAVCHPPPPALETTEVDTDGRR